MISIKRLAEPKVLQKNGTKWRGKFIESEKKRPPSSQYAHEEIKNTLDAMSFNKCFYCECKLGEGKDDRSEVDHHIEVAEKPKLAFEWTNLYLACHGCNSKKLNDSQISVSECLDPCDPAVNPADHLTFEKECICSLDNSEKGQNTIRKYRLDRQELDYLRGRSLQRFYDDLIRIQKLQIKDGGRPLTDKEKSILNSFKQRDHAFSLMFSVYLKNLSQ